MEVVDILVGMIIGLVGSVYLGLRYSDYIEHALERFERFAKRGR